MKFLIAATFLCLALVGQIQGGSLRGLAVQKPHQVYGAPLLENEIHIEETKPIEEMDTTIIEDVKSEEPMISQPFAEYGAPPMVAEVESVPYEDSLPHVESFVNFGTPSNAYLPPVTPKPDLPLLEPGLPALPEAPVVPIEEPIPEVPDTYLPPVMEVESTPLPNVYLPPVMEKITPAPMMIEEPSELYGPPPTPEVPDVVELPEVPEIPVKEEKPAGYHYDRPTVTFDIPKVTVHAPEPTMWMPEVKSQVNYKAPSVSKVHIARAHFIIQPATTHYKMPTKEILTPLAVPGVHGVVSRTEFTQNHASSASSSSLQVNKFVGPSQVQIQPQFTHDTVLVEDLKPGFALQSVYSVNNKETSMGSFNQQVTVIDHELPHLSSFGGLLGRVPLVKGAHATPVAFPQATYVAPHF